MGHDRARYGVDGGYLVIPFFVLVEAALWAIVWWTVTRGQLAFGVVTGVVAVGMLGVAAGYFYTTGPGKRSVWRQLLDELGLRGDERARWQHGRFRSDLGGAKCLRRSHCRAEVGVPRR